MRQNRGKSSNWLIAGALLRFCVLYFQCPEAIIELYNSVLDHLGAAVSSKSLQRLSWPISEFTKNEERDHGTKKILFRPRNTPFLVNLQMFVEELNEMFSQVK